MRITGGFLRGRALIPPADQTIRPTADKTRLAVFNMLESRGVLRDAIVIDAFCGTGALGLEAISRGASRAVMIDRAHDSMELARQNARKLGVVESCQFLTQDAMMLASRPASISPATLVFLDPPYRQGLVTPAVEVLVKGGWLDQGATIVVETEKEWVPVWPDGFEEVTHKTYGQSAVYRALFSG